MQILLSPFVWLLMFFYNFFNNYGLALILFALLVKFILFPLSLKGKRGMIQMTAMQGKMQKLQKMYGNNKEKYNLEVQKLYEKEKVNPMSGCLWTMLPLLVLLPLYAIVREPLTYMMNVAGQVQFDAIAKAVNWSEVAQSMGWIKEAANSFSNAGYNQLYLASLITPENVAAVQAAAGEGAKIIAVNFNFLGLNLAHVPNWQFWAGGLSWSSIGLFLMPLISAGSSLVFSMVSMKTNAINQQTAQATNSTNKTMMLMSPLISLWIGFSMPAALSVYWIAQSLISMGQEFLASKMLKKDYAKAAEEAARREAEEKEEEKRQKELERQERARRIEEQKNTKGKKAPKKDAEDDKIPAAVKEASRVGIRTYARGRNYDPTRFNESGPTLYHEAQVSATRQTEEEEELKYEAEELEQVALEEASDVAIVEEILEEKGLEADAETISEVLADQEQDAADGGETKYPE